MKKTFSSLILLAGMTAFFSCKSSSDNFVGKWADCEDPKFKYTITKQGDKYNVHEVNENVNFLNPNTSVRDFVLEKKGDYLLSEVNGISTLRYDKTTTRLTLSKGGENSWEFCKTSN